MAIQRSSVFNFKKNNKRLHVISEKNMVEELKTSVLDQTVSGALLDSYVAGYWARIAPNSVLKDSNLRVGTVLDHQFAYGFVIAGALQNDVTERCMRKKLNSMETDITAIIQEKAKTMEVKKNPHFVRVTSHLNESNGPFGCFRAGQSNPQRAAKY